MITLKQIAVILENCGREECISNVKIDSSRGVVFSYLESRIDSKKLYKLLVEPDEKLQELQIVVLSLMELPENSSILPRLFQLNPALRCGSLFIEPSNGKLYFQMTHLCEDRNGPAPGFIGRMLTCCVKNVRVIEHVLLFGTMLEVGVPQEKAEQLVENVFGDHFITNWNHLMESKETKRVKEHLRSKNHDHIKKNR